MGNTEEVVAWLKLLTYKWGRTARGVDLIEATFQGNPHKGLEKFLKSAQTRDGEALCGGLTYGAHNKKYIIFTGEPTIGYINELGIDIPKKEQISR